MGPAQHMTQVLRYLQVNFELTLDALLLQKHGFHFRYLRSLHSTCLVWSLFQDMKISD